MDLRRWLELYGVKDNPPPPPKHEPTVFTQEDLEFLHKHGIKA